MVLPVEPNMTEEPANKIQSPLREPLFNISAIVIWLITICALLQLLRAHVLTNEQDTILAFYGAFIPARYAQGLAISPEAITSVVSYSFLHGSWSHLFNNCLWLIAFGSPLANTIGSIRFLLLWAACSAFAALFHYFGQPYSLAPMIGASGAVAGFMGAAARFGFVMNRREGSSSFMPVLQPINKIIRNRNVIVFLGIFLTINFAIGSGQLGGETIYIAWQAHIGGMIAGFLLIPLFLPSKPVDNA
jgi:membrane associated rhomboid family serine protease